MKKPRPFDSHATPVERPAARQVWKFPVPMGGLEDVFTIDVPHGAEPLTVQLQGGDPQLWALVDPSQPRETRTFRIAGTGHSITERIAGAGYIGTFQVLNGRLVFHVFEIEP
jgi:hypothetical protein